MAIRYELRIQGKLDVSWSTWFDNFVITHDPAENTIITGEVCDEAAFYGLISRARDLGLTILSVERH